MGPVAVLEANLGLVIFTALALVLSGYLGYCMFRPEWY
jgi:hypothetical protein